ncbi:actin cytoskeleton-regulatory complex protein pan1-like [Phalaenopsis equestris]|uniref:actin cytoskeleton-regulatory complex protein pan1-like n=1 Tax=Phalaenopsis equestris TaxID=78828 RepID=UPI0009E41158|nr:actin cytoskeleton-regulatory complex protein pan1-like [Phalaenopsis equestris]
MKRMGNGQPQALSLRKNLPKLQELKVVEETPRKRGNEEEGGEEDEVEGVAEEEKPKLTKRKKPSSLQKLSYTPLHSFGCMAFDRCKWGELACLNNQPLPQNDQNAPNMCPGSEGKRTIAGGTGDRPPHRPHVLGTLDSTSRSRKRRSSTPSAAFTIATPSLAPPPPSTIVTPLVAPSPTPSAATPPVAFAPASNAAPSSLMLAPSVPTLPPTVGTPLEPDPLTLAPPPSMIHSSQFACYLLQINYHEHVR